MSALERGDLWDAYCDLQRREADALAALRECQHALSLILKRNDILPISVVSQLIESAEGKACRVLGIAKEPA